MEKFMRHIKQLAFSAVIVAILFSAFGSNAQAQTSKVFSDWVAACDNTLACTAIGMGTPGSYGGGLLVVQREAGAAAAPKVTLVAQFEWGDSKQRQIEFKFDEPGFENVLPKTVDMARTGSDPDRIPLPAQAYENLVAALRKAKKLSILRRDIPAVKEAQLEISLAGAVAALLWIDERQGRIRNVTASISKGTATAGSVLPPRDPPVVTRAKTTARKLDGKPPMVVSAAWKKACDEWQEALPDGHTGFELAAGLELWSMPCTRGAYNFSSMFFLAPRGGAVTQLRFETLRDGRLVKEEANLVNSQFEPKELSLSFFAKGRGIGDCGIAGKHVWDGQAFRLVDWFAMDACNGVLSDLWPRLWRAQVK
jgi:hypothetical protein